MPVSKTKVVAAKPEKDVFFFKRQEVEWKKAGLYIVPFFFFCFSPLLHKTLPLCTRNYLAKGIYLESRGLRRELEDGEKQDAERRGCRPEPGRLVPSFTMNGPKRNSE